MDKIRFIVRARAEGSTLNDFLTMIRDEPELELLNTIGPEDRPHTAVVATTQEHASAFEQRFRTSPELMIERDRPLSLFDKTADFLQRSERNTNA
ncbi:hypothetical protein [Massilia sp. TSP1-1-2]|uniref:hypothetical protein n=1 Tax=Massilia sp. TSP1-1-2 TaxID=2804649 RepID=UPI003CF2D42F